MDTLTAISRSLRVALGVAAAAAVGIAAFAALAGPAENHQLPPIGERKYIVDEKSPYAPVAIQEKGKVVKETYLKDPIAPGTPIQPRPPVKRVAQPAPKPRQPLWQPTRMRFNKLAVRGHLNRPRVEFTRDILPVGRADEPVRQDFMQKVFEPVRDDNF
jgi:hypothetical protein